MSVSLTRALGLATRLDFIRGASPATVVISRPSDVTWLSDDATFESGEDGRLRVRCPAACTLRGEAQTTAHVEYTLSGLGVGPIESLEINDASPQKDDQSHIGRSGELFDVVHRTRRVTGPVHLTLKARGDFTLTQLTLREASLLTPMQLAPAPVASILGCFRTAPAASTELILPALFATSVTTYEWPLTPNTPRTLHFHTALVPRHLAGGTPMEMQVEVKTGATWESRFKVVRGATGDDGNFVRASADLARGEAVRLTTRPASGSKMEPHERTVTVAWGAPTVVTTPQPPDSGRRPDVVIITLDALRADHIGAFGSTLGLTPALDALCAQGACFTEARSQRGETWVAMTSLAHGSYPEEVDVGIRGAIRSRGHDSLAQVFADAGYRTARIGNFKLPPGQIGDFEIEYDHTTDTETVPNAEQFLANDDGRPTFLWIHLQITHYPYLVEPPFWVPERDGEVILRSAFMDMLRRGPEAPDWASLRDRNLRLYQASIRAIDASVARLTEPLLRADRKGGPAIMALAADHGSAHGEKGLWFLHGVPDRHVLRIPMVLVAPGRVPAGARVDRLVRLMDVAPTLLDYADLLAPVEDHFSARTLRGLIEGRPEVGRTNIVQVLGKEIVVVETDTHKLVANPFSTAIAFPEAGELSVTPPRASLHAWRTDPEEQKDLSTVNPLLVGELWRLAVDARGTLERTVSPETRRLLMQAGYAAPGE